MPANKNYTLIKLMRGNAEASEAWIPETGEPLWDKETGTLRLGDSKTLGGIPINTNTSIDLICPQDLNKCKIWGRYFLNGEVSNLPDGCETPGKFFLTVQTSDIGTPEIWQTLQILEGKYSGKTFNRVSLDSGLQWSTWKDTSGTGFDSSGSGTTEGDGNINNYIFNSQVFVENISNGPSGSDGCNGFLFTYRAKADSPHIFQQLILVGCEKFAGKVFYRYSANSNLNWNSPGYNWQDWTDYVHKDLLNATGVLPAANGGTNRKDGTVFQADQALKTFYSSILS